eukprot:Hpha_TRINITY_DN15443_c2_g10::TRINITY_DN15443_c2_g10_i2::g.174002::m.174002
MGVEELLIVALVVCVLLLLRRSPEARASLNRLILRLPPYLRPKRSDDEEVDDLYPSIASPDNSTAFSGTRSRLRQTNSFPQAGLKRDAPNWDPDERDPQLGTPLTMGAAPSAEFGVGHLLSATGRFSAYSTGGDDHSSPCREGRRRSTGGAGVPQQPLKTAAAADGEREFARQRRPPPPLPISSQFDLGSNPHTPSGPTRPLVRVRSALASPHGPFSGGASSPHGGTPQAEGVPSPPQMLSGSYIPSPIHAMPASMGQMSGTMSRIGMGASFGDENMSGEWQAGMQRMQYLRALEVLLEEHRSKTLETIENIEAELKALSPTGDAPSEEQERLSRMREEAFCNQRDSLTRIHELQKEQHSITSSLSASVNESVTVPIQVATVPSGFLAGGFQPSGFGVQPNQPGGHLPRNHSGFSHLQQPSVSSWPLGSAAGTPTSCRPHAGAPIAAHAVRGSQVGSAVDSNVSGTPPAASAGGRHVEEGESSPASNREKPNAHVAAASPHAASSTMSVRSANPRGVPLLTVSRASSPAAQPMAPPQQPSQPMAVYVAGHHGHPHHGQPPYPVAWSGFPIMYPQQATAVAVPVDSFKAVPVSVAASPGTQGASPRGMTSPSSSIASPHTLTSPPKVAQVEPAPKDGKGGTIPNGRPDARPPSNPRSTPVPRSPQSGRAEGVVGGELHVTLRSDTIGTGTGTAFNIASPNEEPMSPPTGYRDLGDTGPSAATSYPREAAPAALRRRDSEKQPDPATPLLRRASMCSMRSMQRAQSGHGSPRWQRQLKWRKGALLGQGAFGVVHIALNEDTGEMMAVKNVTLSVSHKQIKQQLVQLRSEIEMMKKLSHPNIVEYRGTEKAGDGSLNIFMEYVAGGNVQRLLEQFGPLTVSVVISYTCQLLEGLDYLHENNAIHRDIKGANILLTVDGVPKLADFGAATYIQAREGNLQQSVIGTPNWMPPEVVTVQGHGKPADVWSLGCTVMEMLAGKAPWSHVSTKPLMVLQYLGGIADGTVDHEKGIRDTFLPLCGEHGVSFLIGCLHRLPSDRPSVRQFLGSDLGPEPHPWLVNEEEEVQADPKVPSSPTKQPEWVESRRKEAARVMSSLASQSAANEQRKKDAAMLGSLGPPKLNVGNGSVDKSEPTEPGLSPRVKEGELKTPVSQTHPTLPPTGMENADILASEGTDGDGGESNRPTSPPGSEKAVSRRSTGQSQRLKNGTEHVFSPQSPAAPLSGIPWAASDTTSQIAPSLTGQSNTRRRSGPIEVKRGHTMRSIDFDRRLSSSQNSRSMPPLTPRAVTTATSLSGPRRFSSESGSVSVNPCSPMVQNLHRDLSGKLPTSRHGITASLAAAVVICARSSTEIKQAEAVSPTHSISPRHLHAPGAWFFGSISSGREGSESCSPTLMRTAPMDPTPGVLLPRRQGEIVLGNRRESQSQASSGGVGDSPGLRAKLVEANPNDFLRILASCDEAVHPPGLTTGAGNPRGTPLTPECATRKYAGNSFDGSSHKTGVLPQTSAIFSDAGGPGAAPSPQVPPGEGAWGLSPGGFPHDSTATEHTHSSSNAYDTVAACNNSNTELSSNAGVPPFLSPSPPQSAVLPPASTRSWPHE